ncbi:M15 family metallopeptidase [Branchiibius sp. NY16-3462-2]|uniref:M15 family metallopeptidase n=1 Tax=Branchiibius sp. NY16-3462-2 TaxID=1807500 RepID=UPI000799B834|nr:M15 family metallopeptidase [Branchiibius sp. NY16-3462-2]KYH43455.1 hypothetical protein AZH51_17035 [Branchiibius sp. NY16-3462-2]
MTIELTRRATLAGGFALLGWAATGSAQAVAAPKVTCYPVTSSRVAVLVSGVSGAVRLQNQAGKVLGQGSALSGTAIVSATVPANAITRLALVTSTGTVQLSVSTTTAALNASLWRVANKRIALPAGFAPALVTASGTFRLRRDCAAAYGTLRQAAARAGHPTGFTSAYRSYAGQLSLYNSYVRTLGRAGADRQCARAGHSEHQLGLSIDLKGSVGTSALAQWISANAWRYGFIVRYPRTATAVTGFEWEPWHVRYVGVPLATDFTHRRATALESYVGLPAAPTY